MEKCLGSGICFVESLRLIDGSVEWGRIIRKKLRENTH